MLVSVVIPTFNRSAILRDCLAALINQDLPLKKFEILVIDDGSKDDTKAVVGSYSKKYKNIFYYRQKNQGQGIARNLGIKKAKGEYIVFIGDDLIVRDDFLSEHVRYHMRYPQENAAVLGFTSWHPRLTLTPVMKWLTNGSSILGKFGGHQFAYEKLKNKKLADYNFFYTINISLKRSLLEKYSFDPEFSGYGWEDIELGYRLHKKVSLKIHYNKNAIGFHFHPMTIKNLENRMEQIGRSAWVIHRRYPELKKVPSMFKEFVFILISNPVSLFVIKVLNTLTQGMFLDYYFYALSKKFFLKGLHNH